MIEQIFPDVCGTPHLFQSTTSQCFQLHKIKLMLQIQLINESIIICHDIYKVGK